MCPSPSGRSPDRSSADRATVLVCAGPDGSGEPRVVLADGSYETAAERVFWRSTPDTEVLRLPLDESVAVRPVRRLSAEPAPARRGAHAGEQRLLAALAPHRAARPAPRSATDPASTDPASTDPARTDSARTGSARTGSASTEPVNAENEGVHEALRRRLSRALAAGEHAAAEALAGLLWRHLGLAGAHRALAACLSEAGAAWADGQGTVLLERRLTGSVRAVLERLRATSVAAPASSLVVLAVPPGDQHTLALTALAHQLHEAGHRALVVDDLPRPELLSLLAQEPVAALVLSAHLPLSPAFARNLATDVRAVSPGTLVVVGGPGAPQSARGVDLVSDDPPALIALLARAGAVLSPRERDVLREVAEGRTNSEIAEVLGMAPATVKTHLDHVFAKTGTEHRAAAVARALRQGWIS